MNPAAVHLALNVFPPVLNLAALVVLALGVTWKSQHTLRAGLVVLVLSSLVAIPVYLTGEPTEELVEEMEGVNRVSIHPHEDAAKFALISLSVQGVLALFTLIRFWRRDAAKWAVVATLIVAVWATTVVFRTAYLGGKIRHPETEISGQ